MLHARPSSLPEGHAMTAALWAAGITAVADLREQPDLNMKEELEQHGIAYGHVPHQARKERLRNAKERYKVLVISEDAPEGCGEVRELKPEKRESGR